MLTVIWGINGIHVIDIIDSGLSLNSNYFITHILCQVEKINIQKTIYRKRIKYYLHLNNCKAHNSKATQQKVDSIHFLRVPHPVNMADVAPSDFFLFGYNFSIGFILIKHYSINISTITL